MRLGYKYVHQYGNDVYTIVCLDICEFRRINELWGENTGNKLLCFVYRMLKKGLGENELVCRSSVDRFLLLFKRKQKRKNFRENCGLHEEDEWDHRTDA